MKKLAVLLTIVFCASAIAFAAPSTVNPTMNPKTDIKVKTKKIVKVKKIKKVKTEVKNVPVTPVKK